MSRYKFKQMSHSETLKFRKTRRHNALKDFVDIHGPVFELSDCRAGVYHTVTSNAGVVLTQDNGGLISVSCVKSYCVPIVNVMALGKQYKFRSDAHRTKYVGTSENAKIASIIGSSFTVERLNGFGHVKAVRLSDGNVYDPGWTIVLPSEAHLFEEIFELDPEAVIIATRIAAREKGPAVLNMTIGELLESGKELIAKRKKLEKEVAQLTQTLENMAAQKADLRSRIDAIDENESKVGANRRKLLAEIAAI